MIASFSPPGEGSAVLFLWHHRFRRGHRWTVKMPSGMISKISYVRSTATYYKRIFLRRQMNTLSKLGHDRSRPVVASSEVIDVPELEAALDRTFRSNATRKRDRRIKKPVIEPPGDLDAKITH
jgi:hypothetical protein